MSCRAMLSRCDVDHQKSFCAGCVRFVHERVSSLKNWGKWLFLVIALAMPFLSYADVTEDEFNEVLSAVSEAFLPHLQAQNAELRFNPVLMGDVSWWKFDEIHAAYDLQTNDSGTKAVHTVYLFGGLARDQEMTKEGLALIICHELGHGFGGGPYKKDNRDFISVEGQADYYATSECLPRVLDRMPPVDSETPQSSSDFVREFCQKNFKASRYVFCFRAFRALDSFKAVVLSQSPGGLSATYDSSDPSVSTYINLNPYFYPSPQCRLDTLVKGLAGHPRPSCWYAPQVVMKE